MRFYMLVMLALIMVLCMIWGAGEMEAAQAQIEPETTTMLVESVPYSFNDVKFFHLFDDISVSIA